MKIEAFNFIDKNQSSLFVRFENNRSEPLKLDLMLDGTRIESITTTKDNYLFHIGTTGMYHVVLSHESNKEKSIPYSSNTLRIIGDKRNKISKPTLKETKKINKKTKTINEKVDSIDKYHLEIKVEKGNDTLISNKFNLKLNKINLELPSDFRSDSFNTYEYFSYHDVSDFERLNEIAKLIENLDCVDYCCVSPDMNNYTPPKESLPYSESTHHSETTHPYAAATPNFLHLQTYLNEHHGMNVKNTWRKNINGSRATVRHLDFGIYRNHENFTGSNIDVVNSRSETKDCNHGTASVGTIVAENKEFGVTGIAHGCKLYFYDTEDINKIAKDAQPGDIVSLDIQLEVNNKLIPMIHNKSWWEKIRIIVNKGATVILAAGNGNNDLSQPGIMNNYGDNGSILVGACHHDSGRRVNFSNYGHETSLINSWGDWSVTTTGYGELQNAGKNRSYTNSYAGTSSATPLCAGALALIQDYAMSKNTILSPYVLRNIIKSSNYTEGVIDGIGYRPNVTFLLDKVDDFISFNEYFNENFHELSFVNGLPIKKEVILEAQKEHDNLLIKLKNGSWSPEIYIPDAVKKNQNIKITSGAELDSTVIYGNDKLKLAKGGKWVFRSSLDWINV